MNPHTSKTPKSLKGNCKVNNHLNEVISWFGDQKSLSMGLFNQNNKLLINKELWIKCLLHPKHKDNKYMRKKFHM